jgi:hypothetical protein
MQWCPLMPINTVDPVLRDAARQTSMWHSECTMKALKSKLASELLADPSASVQLRQFLTDRHTEAGVARQAPTGRIEIQRGNRAVRVEVTIVPKAAQSE